MRPSSIVNFERVVLLSLALGILNTIISWDKITAAAAAASSANGGMRMGNGTIIGIQVVTILLYLLLLFFISRKGSPVAKWIYVVLSVLGLVIGVVGLATTFSYGPISGVIAVVQYVLSLISLWLLFRPDAKAWFMEGRGEPDPNVFR